MTRNPDQPDDPDEGVDRPRDPGADKKLDEDAAWREIVENFGERATLDADQSDGGDPPATAAEPPAPEPPAEPSQERLQGLFRPAWSEPAQTEATWDDEGHFVPPDPPPVHVLDPRRRLAWAGLFGAPLLMLVTVVLGWQLPDLLMFGLAMSFAGGFVYLVATMPNRRPGDGSGGDGAVV